MRTIGTSTILAATLLAVSTCKDPAASDGAGDEGRGTGSPQCEPMCEEFAASGCSNAPSYDGCLLSCLALASPPACEPAANDYFNCAEATPMACSSEGDPYYPTCGDEWLISIGCAVTESPNPAIEQPCNDYCDSIQAAGCEYSTPTEACNTECLWLGATGTGCDDEWLDYVTCVNGAQMQCALGYAYAPGCGETFTEYWTCLYNVGN